MSSDSEDEKPSFEEALDVLSGVIDAHAETRDLEGRERLMLVKEFLPKAMGIAALFGFDVGPVEESSDDDDGASPRPSETLINTLYHFQTLRNALSTLTQQLRTENAVTGLGWATDSQSVVAQGVMMDIYSCIPTIRQDTAALMALCTELKLSGDIPEKAKRAEWQRFKAKKDASQRSVAEAQKTRKLLEEEEARFFADFGEITLGSDGKSTPQSIDEQGLTTSDDEGKWSEMDRKPPPYQA